MNCHWASLGFSSVQTGTVSVDLHFEDTVSYLNKIIGSDLYTS
jgi:hypothetical protein